MSRGFSDHAYLYSTGAATLNFPADQKPERRKHHWGDVTGVLPKKETERARHHWSSGDDSAGRAAKREKAERDKHHWEDEEFGMATGEDGERLAKTPTKDSARHHWGDGERLAKTSTRESARHHWEDELAPSGNGIGVGREVKKKGLGGWFGRLKGNSGDEVVR